MKKIKIIAFFLLGWQMTAFAQHKTLQTAEQKAQKFSTRLTQELALSEDQKGKIYTLALSNFQTKEKLKNLQSEDQAAMRKENKDQRKRFEVQVKEVLSKDQIAKWDQLKADRKAKHHGHKKSAEG